MRVMIATGPVDPGRALSLFEEIEPRLNRFAAIDPPSFRRRVQRSLGRQ